MIPYRDISECPIDPFHWVEERKTFEYLVKEGKYDPKKHDPILAEAYEEMQYQKIDAFGVSADFELYFYKLREVNKRELEVLQGNKSAETFLNLAKSNLELIERRMKENSEDDPRKTNARLHRLIQSHTPGRNSHNLTVFEFYLDIKDIEELAKERENQRRIEERQRRRHG
jgi:hypothetical protein